MNPRSIIPNGITSCNLLCGCIAAYLATQDAFIWAFIAILTGAFFDFFDGMTARKLGVSGPLGVQLDSLADDITFGLAPAMITFCYLLPHIGWWAAIALLIAPFSALRLARFNIDERQHTSFIGLATPANAIFWGSLCAVQAAMPQAAYTPWVMLALAPLSCYLLNAEIPMFSFKVHGGTWRDHKTEYGFLLGCVLIILTSIVASVLQHNWLILFSSGAACVLWYVLLNVMRHLGTKH